jgi:glycogen synthase
VPPNPKILILTWEIYPVYLGGLGILVRDLVSELERQGAEVTTLLPNIPNNLELANVENLSRLVKKYLRQEKPIPGLDFEMDYYEKNQKRFEKVAEWESIFHPDKKTKPLNRIYPNETPKITKAFAWAVHEWLTKKGKLQDFDCILGMDWMSLPTMKLLKDNNIDIPFILYVNSTEHERSLDVREKKYADLAVEALEEQCLPQADRLIAVSGITKQVLQDRYKVEEDKITVVFNDVEFIPTKATYEVAHSGKNVLFLGRAAKQKGLAFLIDTAKKVVEIDPAVQFLIAGDGERLPKTIETVASEGLERNVLFLGWAGSLEKKILYNTADLFVMPSPSEPFGLTALESIKSDVPVIASENCGFTDLVKSTPTFRYHDTQGFTNLILFFLHNPQERQRLLERQKADLQNHSWPAEVAKVIELARNLNSRN